MTDRIVAAEVIVSSPSRNFVTLKITTSDGVIGYGDATLNGRELAVASYLNRRRLAVPLPRGVLAPGSGDDVRHRRSGPGAVGHQG